VFVRRDGRVWVMSIQLLMGRVCSTERWVMKNEYMNIMSDHDAWGEWTVASGVTRVSVTRAGK